MSFFKEVKQLPVDPILGLRQLFLQDERADKTDLGIGTYRQADGKTLVFNAVKRAEQELQRLSLNKEYLPILGDKNYRQLTLDLIFGKSADPQRMATAQALGGTGALRVAGEFLSRQFSTIYIPDLTWTNHPQIFHHAGLKVATYPYYDCKSDHLSFSAMRQALSALPMGSLVLLQCSSHNPTGSDPSQEQWQDLLELFKERQLLPFFDLAYQGLGLGLEEDAFAVRLFAQANMELLLAYTFSKTLGLYGERAGFLSFYLNSIERVSAVESHLSRLIRSNYSNPPLHGQRLVSTILSSQILRTEWQEQLEEMRLKIINIRLALAHKLQVKGGRNAFQSINQQTGMFAFLNLTDAQVLKLRIEHGLYLADHGRLNLSGLNDQNLERVVEKLSQLVEQ